MNRLIVRAVAGWSVGVALMWAVPSTGLAAVAAIETVAALEDESDEAVTTAVERAVQAAVRGAVAMGLPVVEVRSARVLPGMVAVQVLAREAGSSPFEDELEGSAREEAPTR